AGPSYVHETYYGDGYYDPQPYPRTVYVYRETYYDPRPRVVVVEEPRTVVVRPPVSHHRHAEQRRIEERHEPRPRGGGNVTRLWGDGEGVSRFQERGEPRHEATPPREVAAKPLWREREPGAGLEQAPRKDAPARHGAQENRIVRTSRRVRRTVCAEHHPRARGCRARGCSEEVARP
ncbi:MAG: hypothetical protein ACK4L7_11235, partial [Flavobacteriales bacterium]